MKLSKLLSKITPLPWKENTTNGELSGSDGELLGMILDNPDNGTQPLGGETSDFNSAYLTHAANILPELVQAIRDEHEAINKSNGSSSWIRHVRMKRDITRQVLARAEELEII
jgi:hypothetical protein